MSPRRSRLGPVRLAGACLGAGLLAAVGACSDNSSSALVPPNAGTFTPAPRQEGGPPLAYSHNLTILLRPEAVTAHYSAARERCLKEAALRCTLIQSSSGGGGGRQARPDARIEARLPHETAAAYVDFLMKPMPGEAAGDVVLRDQTTRAEDLAKPVADTARRLAQLNDYRERLTALAQKPDVRVEDLVKIAGEQSQIQSQIEELDGKRRNLDERVDTEAFTVLFRSDEARVPIFGPVAEAWDRAGRVLGDNAGLALRFAIGSLPWIPIVVVFLLIVRTVWRLRRRARPERPRLESGA